MATFEKADLLDVATRIKAHVDNQYRMSEDLEVAVEAGETGESIENLLEEIAHEAEMAKAIADETRESFYHVA